MKAHERRQQERIVGVWRGLLAKLVELGPESESREDLDGYGEVKDYLLDRIAVVEKILSRDARERKGKRARKPASSRLNGNGLHAGENAADNPVSAEVANG